MDNEDKEDSAEQFKVMKALGHGQMVAHAIP